MSECDKFVDAAGVAGNVICLSSADFDSQGNLINFPDVDGVVFFYGNWCGHCVKTKPNFAEFSNAVKGLPIRAFVVDSDKNKDLLARINPQTWGYEVRGFPTIVGYAKGKFYSEYGMDPEKKDAFRKAGDFLEYAQGLGSAKVHMQ